MTDLDPHDRDYYETLRGFFDARREWLRVEAVDRPDGGWDIVLRIDGTYSGEPMTSREPLVEYFASWLANVLSHEGIWPGPGPASRADLEPLAPSLKK